MYDGYVGGGGGMEEMAPCSSEMEEDGYCRGGDGGMGGGVPPPVTRLFCREQHLKENSDAEWDSDDVDNEDDSDEVSPSAGEGTSFDFSVNGEGGYHVREVERAQRRRASMDVAVERAQKRRASLDAAVDVRVIDFAHVTHEGFLSDPTVHRGPDNGFLFGIRNLIHMFEEM